MGKLQNSKREEGEYPMTPKEYLKQAYRLDMLIKAMNQEIEELRRLSTTVQSLQYGERVQTSRNTEARFVKILFRIEEYEEQIAKKMDQHVKLKKQISEVINAIDNPDEKLVLHLRYIQGETWESIGETLFVDERTVRRWHSKALNKITLPDDAIKL